MYVEPVANEMFSEENLSAVMDETKVKQLSHEIISGVTALQDSCDILIIVTNQIFEDGIRYDASTMAYIRLLGDINRQIAERAEQVVEVVAGIPIFIKRMEFKKEEEYMKIIKGFVIAFSIYSKIPVPQFDWKEEDMQYHLCFFPLIGLIIGALEAGWFFLGNAVGISHLCKTLIAVAIPLLVTGGFHMDGFMDTMDAFHSYQDKEKKLAILKDPHIGAFSVLMLVLYYLIYGAAYAELTELSAILVVGIGFALSRSLSGIGVVSLKAAKRRYACLFCRQCPEKECWQSSS